MEKLVRENQKKKIKTDILVKKKKRKLKGKNYRNCDYVIDDHSERKQFCKVMYYYQLSY